MKPNQAVLAGFGLLEGHVAVQLTMLGKARAALADRAWRPLQEAAGVLADGCGETNRAARALQAVVSDLLGDSPAEAVDECLPAVLREPGTWKAIADLDQLEAFLNDQRRALLEFVGLIREHGFRVILRLAAEDGANADVLAGVFDNLVRFAVLKIAGDAVETWLGAEDEDGGQ